MANLETALRMFIPITKIDEEKRLVYGCATAELPDRAGEICDYASSKPYFQAWSAEVAKASDNKSLGNVRSMHGNVAAGKLTAIDFNDEERKIDVAAKIVDDKEWEKVKEGLYSGFSQGGKYIRRWQDESDNGLTRFTAEPHEISLVDLPCLPEAVFSIIKADGNVITKAFKSVIAEPESAAVDKAAEKLLLDDLRITVEEAKKFARDTMLAEAIKLEGQTSVNDELDPLSKPTGEGAGTVPEGAVGAESAPIDTTEDVDGPSTEEVDAKAKEMADAQGEEFVTEKHKAAARAELTAQGIATDDGSAQVPAAAVAEATVGTETVEVVRAAGIDEPQQGFFVDGLGFFPKKKDAVKAMREHRVAVELAKATGPVEDNLDMLAVEVWKRSFSTEERSRMASSGSAESDGSYPIANEGDLRNAIHAFGRSKNKAKTKAHIISRAKSLGRSDLIPEGWKLARTGDIAKVIVPMAADTIGHIHAQMVGFHASHYDTMHKDAAGAHGDAFLGHIHGDSDAMGKSDMAWDATCKCYKGDMMMAAKALAGGPASLGKAVAAGMDSADKGLPTIAHLACLIQELEYVVNEVRFEAETEQDNSPLPAMLAANAKSLCESLKAMVAEETAELLAGKETEFYENVAGLPAGQRDALIKFMKADPDTTKSGKAIEALSKGELNSSIAALKCAIAERKELDKLGARHSKSDQERIQKVHDLAMELGADCDAETSGKAAGGEEIAELKYENASLKATIADYGTTLANITKRLQTVEAQPLPAKAALRAPPTEMATGGITEENIAKMSTTQLCNLIDAVPGLSQADRADWKIKIALSKPTRVV